MASERLNKVLRISVNSSQIDRLVKYYGSLLEDEQNQSQMDSYERLMSLKSDLPDQDETYVMMDGSMILTRENSDWKEVKLARIFNAENRYELSDSRNWIRDSIYQAHLGTHTDFLAKLEPLVDKYEQMSDGLIFINDGAKWIWNWIDGNYPQSIQILDCYHAVEYLGSFAKAVFPNKKERENWINEQKDKLLNDEVEKVIQLVAQIECRSKNKQTVQQKLLTYYENNKKRMMYKTFREKGLLIGSGAIESAHRTVIQKRLKQSGQRWTKKGAQDVLNLRVAYMNKEWNNVINLIEKVA